MKYLFIILISTISVHVFCQSTVLPKVDYANQVLYFDTITKKTAALEKAVPTSKMKGHVFNPLKKIEVMFNIDQATSPIRIPSDGNQTFIMKLDDPNKDPADLFGFTKLERSGKKRKSITTKVGKGINNKVVIDRQFENLIFTKISDNLCLVTFRESLEPGEYTFYYMMGFPGGLISPLTCFAFAIEKK